MATADPPRESTERSRAYYDDFSTSYERERHRGYHAMLDDLETRIVEPLSAGRDVLEVGCGTGLILARLARNAKSAKGVDLSPGMLERAKQRGLDVTVASATALPFPDASFDVVCSFKVLAHVPEIEKALSEMARVCRPGGHVVAEFYNPQSLRFAAKRLAGPQPISDGRTEADVYTRWDSPRQIRGLLPASLDLVDLRGVRILTPAAFIHRIPLLGALLARAEALATNSPLTRFGGFLIAVGRKRG